MKPDQALGSSELRCPRARHTYASERSAQRSGSEFTVPYRCRHCQGWHAFQPRASVEQCYVERKIPYPTLDKAEEAAEVLPHMRSGSGFEGMHTYRCPSANHWHVGHALSYVNWVSRRHDRVDMQLRSM